MHQHLFEHFSRKGHCNFLDDNAIITIFFDKIDPKDPKRQHMTTGTLLDNDTIRS